MESTNYKGIDYGMGQSNIDLETGIRYGIIPSHSIGQAWYDEAEVNYPIACPHCGSDMDEIPDEETKCNDCQETISEDDFMELEPASWFVNGEGYLAEQSRDDSDIFICKSPFYTFAQFCSPCAPGACHLDNPLTSPDPYNKCYCFGHDWFEDGKAPYPIYSIETGKLVNP